MKCILPAPGLRGPQTRPVSGGWHTEKRGARPAPAANDHTTHEGLTRADYRGRGRKTEEGRRAEGGGRRAEERTRKVSRLSLSCSSVLRPPSSALLPGCFFPPVRLAFVPPLSASDPEAPWTGCPISRSTARSSSSWPTRWSSD